MTAFEVGLRATTAAQREALATGRRRAIAVARAAKAAIMVDLGHFSAPEEAAWTYQGY